MRLKERPGHLALVLRQARRCAPLWACLAACGPAPPIDVGTDFAQDDIDTNLEQAASPESLIPSVSGSLASPDIPPMCREGFEPCGGLLAGRWIVEDTCNSETTNRKALQIWGQTFMPLDTSACGDSVQSVRSRWEGMLSFEDGIAIDTRLRHDMIEMNLSRSCLNATFGVNIQAEKVPAVCATLTKGQTSCTAVGGMCACSSRRQKEVSYSGIYAVIGKQVLIRSGPGMPYETFDYCVQGDRLLWREPISARFVVLRREGAVPDETDPDVLR